MAIRLKSRREIGLMRRAGGVVADVLSKLQENAKPGVTTGQLDQIALEMTADAGARALFKGVRFSNRQKAFPGVICASLNDQVVHGIPSEKVRLKEGDILGIDFGIGLDGYCGDAAVTVGIGRISQDRQKLLAVAQEVLQIAVAMSGPGVKWSSIAAKMQEHAESAGFSVVRDFVGHGIGTRMHEEPKVPNFVSEELLSNDVFLTEGMVIAVEPMINAGGSGIRTLEDGWTVVTEDGKCSAHFEHTIAIVEDGCEVLTRR